MSAVSELVKTLQSESRQAEKDAEDANRRGEYLMSCLYLSAAKELLSASFRIQKAHLSDVSGADK